MIIGVFRPTIHPGKEVSSRRSSATRRPRTPSGRPRPFNNKTKNRTSDHLPVIATLTY